MDANVVIEPTGTCWCGCGEETTGEAFFKAGHDKRAEAMLTKLKYGTDDAVAVRMAINGYGGGGRNLMNEVRKKEDRMNAELRRQKIEVLAMTSLAEMSGRSGIAMAVVVVGASEAIWAPSPVPAGPPQPLATSVLRVPMLGSVVTQGFTERLDEGERKLVEARFPDRVATWSLS
jgi:hypothetical protein